MKVNKFIAAVVSTASLTAITQPAFPGIQRYLRVHNDTDGTLTVWVDFDQIGTVAPGGVLNYYIGADAGALTVLNAESTNGGSWHQDIPEALNDYDWYIP